MLTPAFPADLPPLGELVADDPFWRYPSAAMPGEGVAHLRVWLTTGPEPGHLAVVTGTGPSASALSPLGRSGLSSPAGEGPCSSSSSTPPLPGPGTARRPSIWSSSAPMGVPAGPASGPTPEENPRHAGLELWMAVHGHQIVSRTASQSDWRQDEDD